MRKLPVISAAKHVAKTVLNNLDIAFKLSWPWIIALVLLMILVAVMGPSQAELVAGIARPSAGFFLLMSIYMLVFLVAFASIAVNWHRYILLNEIPMGRQILRTDGVVWRYIGNSFLAILIIGIPYAIIGLPLMIFLAKRCCALGFSPAMAQDIPFMIVSFWPLLILMVFFTAFFYRLSSKLPAIALGRRDFGFGMAMNYTAGNMPQLMGLAIVMMIGLWVPSWILNVIDQKLLSGMGIAGMIISAVLQLGYQWIALIIGISLLTSLYGFFAEKRDF